MHKLESVHKNTTQKILWDFEIKTNHPVLTRRSDVVLIKKKKRTCKPSGFCSSSKPPIENERKQKDRQLLGSCQRADKAVEHVGDGDIYCSRCRFKSS